MKKAFVALLTGLLVFAAVPVSVNAEEGNAAGDGSEAVDTATSEVYEDPNTENSADSPTVVVEQSQYQDAAVSPSVVYSTHVQNVGWQGEVSDGAVAGTTGRSLRIEALQLHITGDSNLGVTYQAHVQDYGWMNPVADGAVAGTTGKSKRVEALKINLTGADAANYDIYYCTHVQNYGWLNWVKDGEMSGSSGLAYRIEALAIQIVPKGSAAPAQLGKLTIGCVDSGTTLQYSAHVQNIGWMGAVSNGATAGTTGRSLRVEAVKINKAGTSLSGSVIYKAHVQDIGWMSPVADGAVAGTTGQSKRVEAISISLTGELSQAFDVYYRTHVQDVGWTGWACNGANSGSAGCSKRVEAVQIKLVGKGKPAPGTTANAFYTRIATASDSTDAMAMGMSSATNFLVLVDRANHVVSAYQGSQNNWQRVNRFACDVGKPSSPTVTGNYEIGSRGLYFVTGVNHRCWYWTQIYGNYLFHTVPYDNSSSPVHIVDNRMGQDVSQGCVRLYIENALWIYNTIPRKTKVFIW